MKQFKHLCSLKFTALGNSFRKLRSKSKVEFNTLIAFFALVGAALFFMFLYSFRFFNEQEPFGPILVDETLYLFTFALFIMLFISTSVAAYASLFKSGEVGFLVTRPVEWSEIYFIKTGEALWFSSWALLFIAVPFTVAYGMVKGAPFYFPALCLLYYLPFILLTGLLGPVFTTLILWLLPNKRRQKIVLLAAAALIVLYFLRIQPAVLKEQGSVAGVLSGYLPHIGFAKNALLPSAWITRGMMALTMPEPDSFSHFREAGFFFLLLISNALFVTIPAYSVARALYPKIFLLIQDHKESAGKVRGARLRIIEKIADHLPWPPKPVMAFLEKDIKTFFRDPAEWSQMIIFFGVLLLYFTNLRNLEFHVLKSFWKNIVFILNTVGTYIVLSSFSMRFIFPMLSLEGCRFWIINLSPIRYSQLLLEKFLLGTTLSIILTVPLIFISGWMLEISFDRVLYTTGMGFFVCVGLTGMSVGMGAMFPNFQSTNPSEIISGFGGSILLLSHLAYLAMIGAFLALSKEPQWMVFWTVAALSILIGMFPMKLGMKKLSRIEF